jgi:NADH-quinone oxidoreductase subunit I
MAQAIDQVEDKQRRRRRFRIPAIGMLEAMKVTLRTMLSRIATVHYPEERLDLPPRTRGVIALLEENCTVCMLCAKECPCWCIYIEGHKVPNPKGRGKPVNALDRFAIDYGLCMYCGICVEVCPFDALHWSPFFEYSSFSYEGMVHELDVLTKWEDHVLPPPALVDDADEPARKLADEARAKREQGVYGVIREPEKKAAYAQSAGPAEVVEAPPAPTTVAVATPAAAEAAAPAPEAAAPAPEAPSEAPAPASAAAPAAPSGGADVSAVPQIDVMNLPDGLGPVERGRLKRLDALIRHNRPVPQDLLDNLKPILDQMRGSG